jgi:hypothetical protein
MARRKVSIIAILLALPLLWLGGGMVSSSEAAGLTYVAKKGKSGPPHHAKAKRHHQPGPQNHAPAHGYRAKHKYHYYPGNNVYYDLDRKLYFYRDGDKWKTNVSLPKSIRLNLGKSTSIELDTDLPYKALSKD